MPMDDLFLTDKYLRITHSSAHGSEDRKVGASWELLQGWANVQIEHAMVQLVRR